MVPRTPQAPGPPATKPAAKRYAAPTVGGTEYAKKIKRPPAASPLLLRNDRLGTLVRRLSVGLAAAASWDRFVTGFRGRSYLSSDLETVDHPAAPLLIEWRDNGVPALTSSDPWPLEARDSYVARGCHRSASDHAEFLREEMAEFVESRYSAVLPYRSVRELPNLCLSPAAVKEERARKPRLLCDHSWSPVNRETLPHAPPEAMQFGGALWRILC